MHTTVAGWRFTIVADGHRDSIIVPYDGHESEEQGRLTAFCAARNGYPTGMIEFVRVESGKWCPTGLPGNAEGTAIWCN